jgi:hypothetical protein
MHRFVFQLSPEFEKAHTRHRPRQAPVFHHAFDVQVLNLWSISMKNCSLLHKNK